MIDMEMRRGGTGAGTRGGIGACPGARTGAEIRGSAPRSSRRSALACWLLALLVTLPGALASAEEPDVTRDAAVAEARAAADATAREADAEADAEAREDMPPPSPCELDDRAITQGPYVQDRPRARAVLLFDHDQVVPGQRLRAGVWIGMAPDWHIYWRHSGQSGYPTEVDWAASGAEMGPLQWPTPQVFEEAGGFITTYGYGGEVLFFAEMEIAEDAGGELVFDAVADFLICKVDCVPATLEMRRELPIGDVPIPNGRMMPLFEAAAADIPRTAEDYGWSVEMALSHDALRAGDESRAVLGVRACAGPPEGEASCPELGSVENPELRGFIPDDLQALEIAWQGMREHPDAYAGALYDLTLRAGAERPREERLSGLLFLTVDGEELAIEIDEDLPRVPADTEVSEVAHPFFLDMGEAAAQTPRRSSGASPVPWWQALIFAFIGGLLLNLMPCVFPVLAIKVYGFTSLVHEGRAKILAHGAAYTGGIVGSLLLLGLAVLALRAGGTAVGWGFQFQEPLFIAFVGAVLVIFAANLFGAFEVGVSTGGLDASVHEKQGMRRSFFEGILAVILATPCSAPFLGTAVGFALAGSAWLILGIFAVLGLGLAAPYVALSLMPGWARFIPRPGPWMERFRQVLGFALLGTTVWLLWIIGQSTGPDGMTRLLVFLVACGLAAWVYGVCQQGRATARRVGALSAAMLIGAMGWLVLQFDEPGSVATGSASTGPIAWEVFDEQEVLERARAGQVVFVDFTADWCITCKFNERTVIQTARVLEAVAEHDVAMYKADWTRRDDRIREVLARYGKAGVPMYLVYGPENPEDPEVLPELLTADLLIRSFASAAAADTP